MTAKQTKLTPSAGDVFAIPLRGCGYGFGRMIHIQGKWKLAEFFAKFKTTVTYSEDIVNSGRLIPVHNIVTLAIETGEWPIIKRDPDFATEEINQLVFYKGLKGNRTFFRMNGDPVDCSEGAEAPPSASSMPQFAEYIADMLWERLSATHQIPR